VTGYKPDDRSSIPGNRKDNSLRRGGKDFYMQVKLTLKTNGVLILPKLIIEITLNFNIEIVSLRSNS